MWESECVLGHLADFIAFWDMWKDGLHLHTVIFSVY